MVSGAYRYVRNPMYLAVIELIAGQGLLIGGLPLLLYALAFSVVTHLFVLGYEEPTLHGTYRRAIRGICRQCASLAAATDPVAERSPLMTYPTRTRPL